MFEGIQVHDPGLRLADLHEDQVICGGHQDLELSGEVAELDCLAYLPADVLRPGRLLTDRQLGEVGEFQVRSVLPDQCVCDCAVVDAIRVVRDSRYRLAALAEEDLVGRIGGEGQLAEAHLGVRLEAGLEEGSDLIVLHSGVLSEL